MGVGVGMYARVDACRREAHTARVSGAEGGSAGQGGKGGGPGVTSKHLVQMGVWGKGVVGVPVILWGCGTWETHRTASHWERRGSYRARTCPEGCDSGAEGTGPMASMGDGDGEPDPPRPGYRPNSGTPSISNCASSASDVFRMLSLSSYREERRRRKG
jgi:hypothetical protein